MTTHDTFCRCDGCDRLSTSKVEVTNEALLAYAARHQPPQSWYDENHAGLVGPGEVTYTFTLEQLTTFLGAYFNMGQDEQHRKDLSGLLDSLARSGEVTVIR